MTLPIFLDSEAKLIKELRTDVYKYATKAIEYAQMAKDIYQYLEIYKKKLGKYEKGKY